MNSRVWCEMQSLQYKNDQPTPPSEARRDERLRKCDLLVLHRSKSEALMGEASDDRGKNCVAQENGGLT